MVWWKERVDGAADNSWLESVGCCPRPAQPTLETRNQFHVSRPANKSPTFSQYQVSCLRACYPTCALTLEILLRHFPKQAMRVAPHIGTLVCKVNHWQEAWLATLVGALSECENSRWHLYSIHPVSRQSISALLLLYQDTPNPTSIDNTDHL